jgi:hypothetical protein
VTQRGPIADIVGVAVACVVVSVALSAATALPVEATYQVLTVAAAGAGAAAAILAGVAARLTGDPRPSWIAAALTLYCLIVLPWATVAAVELDVVHRASRLVAYLGALVLLILAVRPPRILRAWGGWALLLATGLLALVVLGLPESAAMGWLVDGPVLTVAVLSGWGAAAAAFVADGFRRRSRPPHPPRPRSGGARRRPAVPGGGRADHPVVEHRVRWYAAPRAADRARGAGPAGPARRAVGGKRSVASAGGAGDGGAAHGSGRGGGRGA